MNETQTGEGAGRETSVPLTTMKEGICTGKMLKAARKASGKTIAELAERTCIRTDYIEAMESGDRESLPERAFTLGFVRSYAQSLGLDGCEVVEAFKTEFDEQIVPEPEIAPTLMKKPSVFRPWLAAMALPLAGVLAFASYSMNLVSAETPAIAVAEAVPASAPVEEEKPADPGRQLVAGVTEQAVEKIEATRPEPVLSNDNMVLTASEDSWLQLADEGGEPVWTGVLLAGESREQPVQQAVYLTTGNAGGLSLGWGERTPVTLGKRGAIVRDMALTPAVLGSHYTENRSE